MSTSWFERFSSLLAAIAWFLAIGVGWLALQTWLRAEAEPMVAGSFPVITTGRPSEVRDSQDFQPLSAQERAAFEQPAVSQWVRLATTQAGRVASLAETFPGLDKATRASFAGSSTSRSPTGDEALCDAAAWSSKPEFVPRFERWKLQFTAQDVGEYARQLDGLGIELGVIGGKPGIDYLGRWSEGGIGRRGDSLQEHRLYFTWTTMTPLALWEQRLLDTAGVDRKDRQILRFLSTDKEHELAVLELDYASKRGHTLVKEIAQTVFQSERFGDSYRFRVVDQRYRRPLP